MRESDWSPSSSRSRARSCRRLHSARLRRTYETQPHTIHDRTCPGRARLGGTPTIGRATQDEGAAPPPQTIAQGAKVKIKGVVTGREADSFRIKDAKAVETIVVLADNVRVQVDGKPITDAQRYELRKLVGGIIVEVEGRGNAEGQLAAERVKISSKDIRNAQAIASRIAPVEGRVSDVEGRVTQVEHQQATLAGQVDELTALSRLAREEAERANSRISALDNYTELEKATVTFAVNRAVLTPEAKQALDAVATKAATMKGYAFEITGYTDTTGNAARNRALSEQRANAVVRYLADTHNIPLRRIVTPLGFGQARPTSDNTTPEGRAQNRRVEVKLMQQGGISN
jgi:outer membrane protein OmpA-like peptidoglycan-associated protein